MNAATKYTLGLGLVATFALAGCAGSSAGSYKSAESPPSDPASYGQPGYAPGQSPGIAEESAGADSADFDGGGGPAATGALPPAPSPEPAGRASRSESVDRDLKTDDDPFSLQPKKSRPGLATQWGERRFSRVTTAPFVRANRMSPFAVSKLFYNDPQGIQAMSDTLGGVRRHTRRFAIGAGHVELGVRDGSGRFLTGFTAGGDNFVTGVAGRRYTIVVKNHSPGRVEAVISVDGLDVIDGKAASFSKRGYLIDPFGDLEIDGFRTSNNEVAAFRFGSVQSSYAKKKHGNTRNVGVIGAAMFHERGDSPRLWGTPRSNQDVRDRASADPFPQRFASPPN